MQRVGPVDEILRNAAADDAPEVRAAAAIAYLKYGWLEFPREIRQALRKDTCAAVRALAYLPPQLSLKPPRAADFSQGLRDANPIIRTLCLKQMVEPLRDDPKTLWASRAGREARLVHRLENDRERIRAAMKAGGVADDPWLRLAEEAFLAENTAKWYARIRHAIDHEGEKRVIPPEIAEWHAQAGNVIADLLASGKRSHVMLTCSVLRELLPTWPSGRLVGSPDFGCIAAHAESTDFLARLICTAACGTLDPAVAEPRLLKALDAGDPLERFAGLWACCTAAGRPVSPALQERLLGLLGSSRPPEADLASRAIGIAFPFDKVLAILEDWRRNGDSAAATAILQTIIPYGSLQWSSEDGKRNQVLLQQAVLAWHDADLQSRFFHTTAYRWMQEDDALFLSFIEECEPAALCTVATFNYRQTQHHTQGLKLSQAAIDAIVDRATGLVRKADGTPNLEVISALAGFAVPLRFSDPIGLNAKYYEIITPFLETCFRPGATDAEIAAGGEFVRAIVSRCWNRPPSIYASIPGVKWGELPEGVRRACARFLGYAGHPRHGKCAVEALALCYQQLGGTEAAPLEPEMVAAMEKARVAIMETGSPADQTEVLLGLAWRAGAMELRDNTLRQLQNRLIAGTVPADLREKTCQALERNTHLLTSDFVSFLFDRVAAPDEDVPLRNTMIAILRQCPDQYGRLFPIIVDLIARGESVDVRHAMETIQFNLDREPAADWADAAGALGFAVATCDSTKRCVSRAREVAMKLFVKVVGRDAAEDIESMIQDEKLAPEVRAAAATQLLAASPDTKLLPVLARNYNALPVEVRKALGKAVAGAENAEGAADFMTRFFRDEEMLGEYQMMTVLEQLKVPVTPDLRAALTALGDDPEYGELARQAIGR